MSHYFDDVAGDRRRPSATVDVELPDASLHAAHRPRRVQPRPPRRRHRRCCCAGAPPPPPTGDAARPRLRRRADRPRRSPAGRPAPTVWAVDVNERARALCAANAAANGLTNVAVAAPDDVPGDVRFDADLVEPADPHRQGRAARAAAALARPPRRRRAGAVLVVQKHLGADSLQRWLDRAGLADRAPGVGQGLPPARGPPSIPPLRSRDPSVCCGEAPRHALGQQQTLGSGAGRVHGDAHPSALRAGGRDEGPTELVPAGGAVPAIIMRYAPFVIPRCWPARPVRTASPRSILSRMVASRPSRSFQSQEN